MHLKTLLTALSLFSASTAIKASEPVHHPVRLGHAIPYCTTANITAMDVEKCICKDKPTGCLGGQCDVCNPVLTSTKNTLSCGQGCHQSEEDCEGCGLWFHTLCDCLKGTTPCVPSSTIKKGAQPVWVHLIGGPTVEPLITTTELIPGILEMSHRKRDEGWYFAHTRWLPDHQALALNSVRVRKQEQVHIHMCHRNATTSRELTGLDAAQYPSLRPLPHDEEMWCLATSGTLNRFATTVNDFLGSHKKICPQRVGAGVIQDGNGNTWGCVTTNTAGPISRFCH
ncbi:hypothetical protein B0T10DRAFT_604280 [Thelonectria olida]|uniref:Uncharacterized protein n=1 Tax=Thelonectria olida TaxID=1576542 RepID=A0A9P9ARJ5_9HYPO|nr:hypothetical protein B0T10DRAFT_604280 [Thelonectria olida]